MDNKLSGNDFIGAYANKILGEIKEVIEEEYIKTVWGIGFKMNNN